MTMSPRSNGAMPPLLWRGERAFLAARNPARDVPARGAAVGGCAGNDSTLVGAFLPRHVRLRTRIAASSVRTTETSPFAVVTCAACAIASRTMALARGVHNG